MAKLIDLPNELLECIFDYAIPEPPPPPRTPGDNLDTPSRAMFPFNVASMCIRCLEVLKSNGKYWRHVVIDLADDPTGFLDTFSLFEVKNNVYQPGITVTVFSSDTEDFQRFGTPGMPTRMVHKSVENSRARVVFQNLERSLERCSTIQIQLVYQSSLPSMSFFVTRSNPLLRNLTLTSLIHDEQLCDSVNSLPLPLTKYPGSRNAFPRLSNISLTGKCFMELCVFGPHWVLLLKPSASSSVFQIAINHYRFDNDREVEVFYDSIASLRPTHTLTLSNLTLGYTSQYRFSVSRFHPPLTASHIFFDSVSRQFLTEFLPRMMYCDPQFVLVSLKNTSIPSIRHLTTKTGSPTLPLLQLIDMSGSPQDISLYSSIATFGAEHVRLLRCEGVTDGLLYPLSVSTNPRAAKMKALELHDCADFTSEGLRALVIDRQCMHNEEPTEFNELQAIDVHGVGPPLSEDDATWFLDAKLNSTQVEWNVERTRAAQDGYLTDLRPSHITRNILEDAIDGWCVGNSSKSDMYTLSWRETSGFLLFD
ncbi:hypothetical protein HYPSUDRAFT_42531 [Hypholoma sublateritium FD-334 SS-4]|uniref:F-box domain-containing protein n=1 Tax=Hypholoma sublateritium (strain FD-334 SS-4) TaxID=945553 RepID=A0A0D2PM02_HYPSF|nr:hypothetical protein HYPSUDRAFT_42531 [Hypholoma sublateritium FD-334 SS-4]